MSMIDWYIERLAFCNCNCDWSYPCQFDLRLTDGHPDIAGGT